MSVSGISSQGSAVDFTELRKKMAERMAEKMLKDLDTNGDGSISKAELAKASTAASGTSSTSDTSSTSSLDDLFKALDSDGDGAISKSDLAGFIEKAGPPDGGPQGAGGPPPGPPPGGPPPSSSAADGASKNSDSTSSKTNQVSDPADTNGDGTVSTEERMAFAYQQLMAALQRISESTSQSTTAVTS
jgi:Ca2+-binding EF-hand superfamily protein